MALRRVLDAFDTLPCRTHHCLGNHCLYNLPRATLNARLAIPEGPDGEVRLLACWAPPCCSASG